MWDYRVVKRVQTMGRETFFTYAIHEVYYDEKNNPHSVTETSVEPMGKTPIELARDWYLMGKALTMPVIDYDDIVNLDKDDFTLEELTASGNMTFKHDDGFVPEKEVRKHRLEDDRQRAKDEIAFSDYCVGKDLSAILGYLSRPK